MKLCELDLIRMPLQIANQAQPVGLLLIAIPNSFENIFLRNLHYAGVSQQSTGQDHATQPIRGDQLGLREDEVKFYDALIINESAVRELSDETLKKILEPAERRTAEILFYTGCNVLRTPHIVLNVMDILDGLSLDFDVVGGTAHYRDWRRTNSDLYRAFAWQLIDHGLMLEPDSREPWFICEAHQNLDLDWLGDMASAAIAAAKAKAKTAV